MRAPLRIRLLLLAAADRGCCFGLLLIAFFLPAAAAGASQGGREQGPRPAAPRTGAVQGREARGVGRCQGRELSPLQPASLNGLPKGWLEPLDNLRAHTKEADRPNPFGQRGYGLRLLLYCCCCYFYDYTYD